eukprot:30858-Pelagococcus_subviridis.AAC.5
MHGRTSEAQAARDGRPRGPRRGAGRVQGPPAVDRRRARCVERRRKRGGGDQRPAQARFVVRWLRVGVVNVDPEGLCSPAASLSAHRPSLTIPTHRDAFQLRP